MTFPVVLLVSDSVAVRPRRPASKPWRVSTWSSRTPAWSDSLTPTASSAPEMLQRIWFHLAPRDAPRKLWTMMLQRGVRRALGRFHTTKRGEEAQRKSSRKLRAEGLKHGGLQGPADEACFTSRNSLQWGNNRITSHINPTKSFLKE